MYHGLIGKTEISAQTVVTNLCVPDSWKFSVTIISTNQMQLKPTRQDAVLDLFMTNKPALVKEVSVLPGISDHDIVVVDTKHRMDINRKAPRNIKQWSTADWERIKTDTVNYQQTFLQEDTERSVEQNYSNFQNFMNTIMKKYVPEKLASSRRNVPWITPGGM